MKKIDFDTVKMAFENKGLILLSDNYINDRSPLYFKCLEHDNVIQKTTYDSIRSKKSGCKICGLIRTANSRRQSFEDVQTLFINRGLVLLEDKYISSHINMNYVCNKHPDIVQHITLSNLKAGKGCRFCGINSAAESKRLNYNDIYLKFKKKNLELLTKNYTNCTQLLEYICLKHPDDVQLVSYGNFIVSKHICRHCRIDAVSGKNNWNWNWNLTEEERIIQRKYEEYNIWRSSVYNRDNYTCQCCYSNNDNLNAHHILSYSNYPELRININNGITLCKDCHVNFHILYGYKNATQEDLDIFRKIFNRKEVI